MAPTREKKKAKRQIVEEETEKDRLSDLPDSLLLHILSFLPETKFAVQTSVLSKRWKCLWASLPALIFKGYGKSFSKLVRRVLSGRDDSPVTKFCYHSYSVDKSLFTRIVNYSASHNVQHFSIYLFSVSSLRILFPIFNRCKLKTLELGRFKELHLLKDINLPSLTTLHLFDCSFGSISDDKPSDSIDPFISLVNLKSLHLDSCRVERGVRRFKISGPQLHSLTMNHRYQFMVLYEYEVEIFAPKLHSFNIKDIDYIAFSNLDFPLLEMADIDLFLSYGMEDLEKSHLKLINLFQGLYHAQSLYISSYTIKDLKKFSDLLEAQASPFVRLKTLNFRSNSNSFSITDKVMNYFISGSSSVKDIRIKTQEKQEH